ncbi:MAG TPA: RidA family protein [Acidimicrobiales bacterium]|jgi:2-iminobutanoate/2-iminopropanoate deaminase|nr:RidA family protein [Acidimicrobiales bacterium]
MNAPEGGKPVGPYSPVRRAGDWVVISGQVGAVPGPDGAPRIVEGGTAEQLRQVLTNVTSVLAKEGATLSDVVKTTVFLVDMSEFALLNEIWIETWPEPRPTRSAIGVAALPMGARIEVEAWAYKPGAGS